jgi:hypothetical protein
MSNLDPVDVLEGAEHTIEQGRALVRAIEALGIIEPTAWFERTIARLLLAAYKRRLRAIIGAVPAWMGDRILQASERIPAQEAALFGENGCLCKPPLSRRCFHLLGSIAGHGRLDLTVRRGHEPAVRRPPMTPIRGPRNGAE